MKNISAMIVACFLASNAYAESFRFNYNLNEPKIPTTWQKTASEYGDWNNDKEPYGCTNWAPSTSAQGKGVLFNQSATDCNQDQKRWAQDYVKNNVTGKIQKSGSIREEKRTITASSQREAIGVLENWITYDPTYSNWVDANVLYGCSTWAPDPASYSNSATFTQNAACKTDQIRTRQDREQEKFTSEIRIVSETPEVQTLSNQPASRAYTVSVADWKAVAPAYACTNWSPDPSTVKTGESFEQTATDCKQDEARVRTESYVDHKSGQTVGVNTPSESRTVTASSTRTAYGTKAEESVMYDGTHMVRCTMTASKRECTFSWGTIGNIGQIDTNSPAGQYIDKDGYRYTASTMTVYRFDDTTVEWQYAIKRDPL